MQRKVILMLQKFIIERENADKRRKYRREKNLDLSLTQFHIIELIDKMIKSIINFLPKS